MKPGSRMSPEQRARVKAGVHQGLSRVADTPEFRAKQAATARKRWDRPGQRDALSERNRRDWQDPAYRARMTALRVGNTYAKNAPVKGECAYCGGPATEAEHVLPKSRGGSNAPENIVLSCHACNGSKGKRTPDEWLAEAIGG